MTTSPARAASFAGEIKQQSYQLKRFKYNSHYWILKFLSEANRPLRILEVGTADGYFGAILKEQGHYVAGVEREEALAMKARHHYDSFYQADIEEFDFPFRDGFDYILFADVLEHLRDPAAVLRRSLPALKRNGEVVISVPNVANFTVRLSLLFGMFNYANRGILDKTHLRFFTLSTIKNLLQESGGRIVEVVPSPIPVQLVLPVTEKRMFYPLHEFNYFVTRLFRGLFAYQFVMRARAMH
ncbi:MAG TPA: class I SAM-dependent methyltransferase [Candidatus Binatia bacterium]|jgi:2-polyprenyl-3-methyl-5-hydroxy-6-metoxy-1,4-benzoquinol methylase|nr:class I SAM-dependent methyltransferase [Candidatus Binatia bacterium]